MNIVKMSKRSESGAPLALLTALILLFNSVEVHAMKIVAKWPGRAKISGGVGMILANANPAARNTIMQFLNSPLGDMRTYLPGLIDATRPDAKDRAWIVVEESRAVRAESADSYFQVMGRQPGDFIEQMTAAEDDNATQVKIARKLVMLYAAIADSNAPADALEELQRTQAEAQKSLSEAKQAESAAGIHRVAENFWLKSDTDFVGNPVGAVLAKALSLNRATDIPIEGRLRQAARNVKKSAKAPAVEQRQEGITGTSNVPDTTTSGHQDFRSIAVNAASQIRGTLISFVEKDGDAGEVHQAVQRTVSEVPISGAETKKLITQIAEGAEYHYGWIYPLQGLTPQERRIEYIAGLNLVLYQLKYAVNEIKSDSKMHRHIEWVLSEENALKAHSHISFDFENDKAELLKPSLGKPLTNRALEARYYKNTFRESISEFWNVLSGDSFLGATVRAGVKIGAILAGVGALAVLFLLGLGVSGSLLWTAGLIGLAVGASIIGSVLLADFLFGSNIGWPAEAYAALVGFVALFLGIASLSAGAISALISFLLSFL